MTNQIVPKVLWFSAFCASAYITVHLARVYILAITGHASAQWEFAFFTAPLPILLAAVSFLISILVKPKLHKVFVILALLGMALPTLLTAFVILHAR